jgi:hypothetical protein
MSGRTTELAFDRTPQGFVLRRTTSAGEITSIPLSEKEVLGLQQTIAILQAQILSARRMDSGSIEPIFVLCVVQAAVQSDALGENILLTTVAPTGHHTTLSFPRHIAQHIADRIPATIATMPATATRQ